MWVRFFGRQPEKTNPLPLFIEMIPQKVWFEGHFGMPDRKKSTGNVVSNNGSNILLDLDIISLLQ